MRTSLLVFLMALAIAAQAQVPCDVAVVVTSPTCPNDADGSIAIVPNTPGLYTYLWPQDPGLQDSIATGLAAGPYSVIVTDTNGCYSEIDTVVVPPVVPPLGTINATNITCAGMDDGTLTFTVNPGPYTWEWVDDPTNTDPTRTDLAPGPYVVVVNGGTCPSWIFTELGNPAVTISGQSTYCPADPPTLSADNWWGFQPDIWIWSTGDSTASFLAPVGLEGAVEVTATDTSIGCTSTADVVLTMLPAPTVSFAAPDSLCLRSYGLAITTYSTADSLVWRWGASGFSSLENPSVSFEEDGWQPISLQGFYVPGCGSVPVKDSVFIRPRIPALFTAEQLPCTPTLQLHLQSGADSCAFFVGDSLMLSACNGWFTLDLRRYRPYDLTFYSTRPDHCDDTSSVLIDVQTGPVLLLPNAFTPNNDGINDLWPGPLDIPDLDYQVQVFDRWGELLWGTKDTEEKWSGDDLPMGVYVYVVHMRDPCNPMDAVDKYGTVTLFR